MPIIASAKKRVKQNEVARVRNHAALAHMRSLYKNIIRWTTGHDTDVKQAKIFHNEAQKAIDTCTKKNLIHKNNAARKKSRIARLINAAKKLGGEKKEEKGASKKASAPKSTKKAPAKAKATLQKEVKKTEEKKES